MNDTRKKLRLKKPAASSTPNTPAPKEVKGKKTSTPPVPPPFKPYEIPGFPRSEGPTGTNALGVSLAATRPLHTIVLDEGTFWYVWQMVEAKANIDHQKCHTSMPNVKRVTEEAVRAFREASNLIKPTASKPKLRLKVKK